jgi:hypothetical protein
MGRHFVAETLLRIATEPAPKVPEAVLEPIVPGAWAAWARAAVDETSAAKPVTTAAAPTSKPVREPAAG